MPKQTTHTTSIRYVPPAPDAPAVHTATCTCGWTWSNRFTSQAAKRDAERHARLAARGRA